MHFKSIMSSRAPAAAPAAVVFEQRIMHAFMKLDDTDTRNAVRWRVERILPDLRVWAYVQFETDFVYEPHTPHPMSFHSNSNQGLADLEDALRKAEPHTLQHLLKLLSDANIDRRKPAGRAALMRFIALASSKHADALAASFKRLSRIAFARLKDTEAAVRENAAIALATCTLHLALHHQVATPGTS